MENKKEGFCQICIAQSKTDLSAAVIPQYGYVYCSSPYPLILVSLNLVVLFDSEEKKEDISIPTTSGQRLNEKSLLQGFHISTFPRERKSKR